MGLYSPQAQRTELVKVWSAVRQVLVSPTLGFFRLAEGGSLLPPLVLATVVGLIGPGMGPLKGVLIAGLGPGRTDSTWLTWAMAAFLLLAPLYYAALAAGYALFGVLIAGRGSGIGLRAAFRRLWVTIGWVNLPLAVVTAGVIVWMLTAGAEAFAPVFEDMAAAWRAGLVPSYTMSIGVLGLTVLVWTAGLLVIAIRQALATDTLRAVAIIAVTGLTFGLLVHAPLANLVLTTVPDAERALGRGPAATVSRLAYAGPLADVPQVGDLVAVTTGDTGGSWFALQASPGITLGGTDVKARLGRIVAGPGDRLSIVDGRIHLNGEPLAEPYLAQLPVERAHPEALAMAELLIPASSYLVLPDDRATLATGWETGALAATSDIIGQVVGLHVDNWATDSQDRAETPSASITALIVRDGPSDPGTLSARWRASFRYSRLDALLPPGGSRGWWYASDPARGSVLMLLTYGTDTGTGPAQVVKPSGDVVRVGSIGLPCGFAAVGGEVAWVTENTRKLNSNTWGGSHTAVAWLSGDDSLARRYGATFHGGMSPAVEVRLALEPTGLGLVYSVQVAAVRAQGPMTHWLVRVDEAGGGKRVQREAMTTWEVDWPGGLILEVESQVGRNLVRLIRFSDLAVLDELELPGNPPGPTPPGTTTVDGFSGPDGRPAWWVQSRGVVSLITTVEEMSTPDLAVRTVAAGGAQAWPSADGWCVVTSGEGATIYGPDGAPGWRRADRRAISAATSADGELSLVIFAEDQVDHYRAELITREGLTVHDHQFHATHSPGPFVAFPSAGRGVVFWKEGPSDSGGRLLALRVEPADAGAAQVTASELDVILPEHTHGGRLLAGGRYLLIDAPLSVQLGGIRVDLVLHFFDLTEVFAGES